jgi:glycosyltransferase involved in cell wall biosynthesis
MVATVPPLIRNFYLPYAAHFRRLGWRVEAAARDAGSDHALREAFDRVHDLPLSRSTRDVAAHVRSLRAVSRLLADDFDIVHVHSPIASFLARLAARRLPAGRRPAVVYTVHGFHFHRDGGRVTNLLFRTLERIAGRWTDRLIVINDEDEAAALAARIVPRRRLVRMPGVGIDTDHYSRSAVSARAVAQVRKTLGVPARAPLFLVVGELHPRKRQEDAIAALAAMARRDAHLVLAGEGRTRSDLERRVARLGLGDRVHFTGFVDDIRPLVVTATAVVAPSSREGLARSIMEALALETPVIASTARGNDELLDEASGTLVPIGDVDRLAAAMDAHLRDVDGARETAARGRARVVRRYRIDAVIRMHERVYAEVLTERSGGRES